MEKLKSLFIIFLLLIFISLVAGLGMSLITKEYSELVTGALLILSSIAILAMFIDGFVFSFKNGTAS